MGVKNFNFLLKIVPWMVLIALFFVTRVLFLEKIPLFFTKIVVCYSIDSTIFQN